MAHIFKDRPHGKIPGSNNDKRPLALIENYFMPAAFIEHRPTHQADMQPLLIM